MNCLLIGASGSGKSTSMRNMPLGKIGVYNVAGKPLPFKGNIPMMVTTYNIDDIIASLKRNTTNCYIIDDSQYLMAFRLIDKINETGYAKYTEIARDFKRLIDVTNRDVSKDTIVYFMHHTEVLDDGFRKAKTVGKMIDNWLTLEGLFSIVLMSVAHEGKYEFITQTDGTNTCKSPIGMFPERMENDLMKVDSMIRDFYGLAKIGLSAKLKDKPAVNDNVSTAGSIPKE